MEPLNIVPVRVKIATIIRKLILSGEIPSGSELSLTSISAQLGVSRTPVREAFQTLETEGLISLRMNKGAIVNEIDRDFIEDHYHMRCLLECEAIKKAMENGMDLGPLKKIQNDAESDPRIVTDEQFYSDYNKMFHYLIWEGSKSQKLKNLCEMLWNGPSYGLLEPHDNHQLKSLNEHARILDRMEQGDIDGARKAMEYHLNRSLDNMLSLFFGNAE